MGSLTFDSVITVSSRADVAGIQQMGGSGFLRCIARQSGAAGKKVSVCLLQCLPHL